jgi:glycogen operon protein
MILSGDELSRTQRGNNNAYCQDNELSWLDWTSGQQRAQFLEFVSRIIRLRRQHPVFSRRRYVQADRLTAEGLKEIFWLAPDGREMNEGDWSQEFARCLGVYLAGGAIERRGGRGEVIKDSNFLLLFNAHHETITFRIAEVLSAKEWRTRLDTALADNPFVEKRHAAGADYALQGRSLVLLEETAAA